MPCVQAGVEDPMHEVLLEAFRHAAAGAVHVGGDHFTTAMARAEMSVPGRT